MPNPPKVHFYHPIDASGRSYEELRAAGVTADLHVYDGQAHGDHTQNLLRHVPEAEDAQRELFEFFDKHLN